MIAWGGHREFNGFNGDADGYLLEWDLKASRRSTVYGRAEVGDKDLFASVHQKGFGHRHILSKIGVLTTGYVFELVPDRWGRIGIGADATFYHMPADLLQFWAPSRSYHVFLRWRPRGTAMPMMHH